MKSKVSKAKVAKTFPVPPNDLGIFACHTEDGEPFSEEALTSMIEGPLTAMQEKLNEVLGMPPGGKQIALCE